MSEIKKFLVTTWSRNKSLGAMNRVVMGSIPGGRNFFGEKNSIFFKKNIFPGVFKWFCLYKNVSLTALGPSGRLSGSEMTPEGLKLSPQNGQK